MKVLDNNELENVQGGLLATFLVGVTLGALAKKLYNKYGKSQPATQP